MFVVHLQYERYRNFSIKLSISNAAPKCYVCKCNIESIHTWQLNSGSAGFVTEMGEHLGTGSNTKTTIVAIYLNKLNIRMYIEKRKRERKKER